MPLWKRSARGAKNSLQRWGAVVSATGTDCAARSEDGAGGPLAAAGAGDDVKGRFPANQVGLPGPDVCVDCCSQLRIWHDFGNRSYVSGLLIGSRAVALMGLRTRLGLISGKVFADHKGRQTLGAYFLRSMLSSLSRTPFDRGKRQMVSMAISLGASNRVPCRRTLHAVRASLLANPASP